MDIAKAFEVAFNRKNEKNWEKIYVVVDIHDTILRACYENEETYAKIKLAFLINTIKYVHKVTNKCRNFANFAKCFENY